MTPTTDAVVLDGRGRDLAATLIEATLWRLPPGSGQRRATTTALDTERGPVRVTALRRRIEATWPDGRRVVARLRAKRPAEPAFVESAGLAWAVHLPPAPGTEPPLELRPWGAELVRELHGDELAEAVSLWNLAAERWGHRGDEISGTRASHVSEGAFVRLQGDDAEHVLVLHVQGWPNWELGLPRRRIVPGSATGWLYVRPRPAQ